MHAYTHAYARRLCVCVTRVTPMNPAHLLMKLTRVGYSSEAVRPSLSIHLHNGDLTDGWRAQVALLCFLQSACSVHEQL